MYCNGQRYCSHIHQQRNALLGCPSSMGESIEDACAVHGIDADKLVKELNEYFERKKSENKLVLKHHKPLISA